MKMKEGIARLFKGANAFPRQLTLFSLCGTVGLFNAYVMINGLDTLVLYEKIAYAILWVCFAFYMLGYETKFLHEREIPDIDLCPVKIVFKSVLFFIFLVSLPLIAAQFDSKFVVPALLFELLLAVPFTTIQAGYSYEYDNKSAFSLLKKISISNYVALFIKRLWLIICAYAIVFSIVFFVFFWGGIIFAIVHGGEVSEIGFIISAHQSMIAKLSNFVSEILLTYFLVVSTLVWDYELIKTYESEEE